MRKAYLMMAVAWTVVACGGNPQTETEAGTGLNETFASKVKTVKAVAGGETRELTFAGRVSSNPDLTVNYSPLVNGVIVRTLFSLGDKVTKGQVMLDIRSTELSALQSELIALETSLQVAERELKGAEAMFADKMLSEREFLESQGKVRQAKAAYEKAKADISVYGTDKDGGVFSVVAPATGYVIAKRGTAGETVFADSEPLFAIADLQEVWVVTHIYAGNLRFVTEGMEADITSVSYPNEVFRGKIDALGQVFDPEDKTLKARIVLPNAELKLKPGMSVVVKLRERTTTETVSLPSEAVIFDNDAYSVVVRQDDGFAVRQVTVCGQYGNSTYLGSGIEPGEEVVIRNQLLVYNELKGK